MKLPLAWIGKPSLTLTEHKKLAWSGMPQRYHVTYPGATHKQWKPLQITKRKAS